eukprot:1945294-Amphidinium_carterae.1
MQMQLKPGRTENRTVTACSCSENLGLSSALGLGKKSSMARPPFLDCVKQEGRPLACACKHELECPWLNLAKLEL